MPDVLLVTLNAKYPHASLALRYLQANLEEMRENSQLLELTIDDRPLDVVEKILELEPRIVGLSVYIWNVVATTEVVALLKRVRPELVVVLGGPEVSYESLEQEIVELADYTITQEGERAFRELCRAVLAGERPAGKRIAGGQGPVEELALPYPLYSDHDLTERVVYVEASRGCPFRCEFCLSSLDKAVRYFDLPTLLEHLDRMLAAGARHVKFIDRTFNLRLETSQAILRFFRERWRSDLFVHFEMIPDRFPEELRRLVADFPPGALQFEIGIQTFDDAVSQRISRRQDLARLEDNLRFLRQETGVHIHADLIVGLPGETLESFGRGFDRLLALNLQEIQVGILKRLRGTPIVRHDAEHGMVYSPRPPYEILKTEAMPFETMQRLKRFARYWELLGNRGQFPRTLPKLLPFERFLAFSDWLYASTRQTHKFSLLRLAEVLARYCEEELGLPFAEVARTVGVDYMGDGLRFLPPFMLDRSELPEELRDLPKTLRKKTAVLPARQARHAAVL